MKALVERTGLDLFAIAQIEQGKAVSLSSLLPVLRELRLLNNLDAFIPNIPESPINLLNKHKKLLPYTVGKSFFEKVELSK